MQGRKEEGIASTSDSGEGYRSHGEAPVTPVSKERPTAFLYRLQRPIAANTNDHKEGRKEYHGVAGNTEDRNRKEAGIRILEK